MKSVKRLATILAVLAASALVAPGSAGAAAGGKNTPVKGGTLTYVPLSDTPGFDPTKGRPGTSAIQMFSVYDVLVYQPPGATSVTFRLMESAETTDAKTWMLKFKAGVKFSDGTPFNAAAVQFNWERVKDPANLGTSTATASQIATMEVVNDNTLRVMLAQPNNQFLAQVADSGLAWIASPTAVKASPTGFNTKPVGAGPYVLQSWVTNSQMVLTRNPNYYGKTYLDQLVFKIIPDEAQREVALKTGEVDVARSTSAVSVNNAATAGSKILPVMLGGGFVMFFNTKRAPFDDFKVRQAFQLAWDAEGMTKALFFGLQKPVSNLFIDSSPFHDDKFNFPKPNAAKAQKLFDEIAAQRGGPLEVTFSYLAQVGDNEANWYQAHMASFKNVKVNLQPVISSVAIAQWTRGDVQFGLYTYSTVDASDLSKYFVTGGSFNLSQTSDPAIDAAFAAGVAELDLKKRVKIYETVQQRIIDTLPVVISHQAASWELYNGKKVRGIDIKHQLRPAGSMMPTDVWIAKGSK